MKRKYTITCGKCGHVLEFPRPKLQRTGDYYDCPCCGDRKITWYTTIEDEKDSDAPVS